MITSPETKATPALRGRRRRRAHRFTRRDVVVITFMVAIPLLLDLALVWGPAITTIFLSFTDAHIIGSTHWIGGENYSYMTKVDPNFWPAVRHNLSWLLVFILLATPLGMLLAVLLDRGLRGSRIYQSVFFLPVMLSLALIGIVWQIVYSQQYGLVNGILHNTAPNTAIDWLGNPNINLWAVLVEATWRQAGYVMVLYLAGLKAVDPGLREAAALDGANGWQTFWHVVFPTMRPINAVILVVTIIESLRAFDLVYITNGGVTGLQLLSSMITTALQGGGDVGYGAALGVVLLVISLVPITFFLVQQFRRDDR